MDLSCKNILFLDFTELSVRVVVSVKLRVVAKRLQEYFWVMLVVLNDVHKFEWSISVDRVVVEDEVKRLMLFVV